MRCWRDLAQNRAGAVRVAATRNKNNYLNAQFVRLRARRGPQKAIIAVAASILTNGSLPATDAAVQGRCFNYRAAARIRYRPKAIFTPLALRLRLIPWCVDTIWITTPLSFFIAVALAPPATATPAETAV